VAPPRRTFDKGRRRAERHQKAGIGKVQRFDHQNDRHRDGHRLPDWRSLIDNARHEKAIAITVARQTDGPAVTTVANAMSTAIVRSAPGRPRMPTSASKAHAPAARIAMLPPEIAMTW
jgi:hypothetical protein